MVVATRGERGSLLLVRRPQQPMGHVYVRGMHVGNGLRAIVVEVNRKIGYD